ncbi:DUF982 domain-containing protein [Mesorhizobium sp. BH1-1-5]|uniref:DUF982 domain-containing protein n=1 Tax=unclassified Mesorhizobium TaxID=325217 RepID=UPI001CCD0CB8|nr:MULTISPECIES: DUF982 domain-containing protein [unclassified Mesorhizobium]MBZ9986805.1 DUF982 domain-containing protein [Mesorhizobium sp. BH1-1-5]
MVSGKAIMRSERTKRFRKPVIVQPGRVDRDRVVVSVLDAAEVLLHTWPKPESSARHHAIKACLSVLRDGKPPRVAREAFVAAAKDARIFLGDKA